MHKPSWPTFVSFTALARVYIMDAREIEAVGAVLKPMSCVSMALTLTTVACKQYNYNYRVFNL